MEEANVCVHNVTSNFLQRDLSLNTKGKYMKETHTLAGNVTSNFLQRDLSLYTK